MKAIVVRDKDKLRTLATDSLQYFFQKNQGKPILFLTSGGSSFSLLKNLKISHKDNITIGVLDERYSLDVLVNNFSQLKETNFFKKYLKQFNGVIDTTVKEGESLEDFAERINIAFKNWKRNNARGIVVATIGMGSDGHISGIMPFPENEVVYEGLFNNPRNWVVGYDAGNKNQYRYRATTTLPFLRNEVDFAILYVTGEEKKQALGMFLADDRKTDDVPARVIHQMKDVLLFTDIEIV